MKINNSNIKAVNKCLIVYRKNQSKLVNIKPVCIIQNKLRDYNKSAKMAKCTYCAGNKCFYFLTNLMATYYESTAGGRISNWLNKVGGNEVYASCRFVRGNKDNFIKKTLKS